MGEFTTICALGSETADEFAVLTCPLRLRDICCQNAEGTTSRLGTGAGTAVRYYRAGSTAGTAIREGLVVRWRAIRWYAMLSMLDHRKW